MYMWPAYFLVKCNFYLSVFEAFIAIQVSVWFGASRRLLSPANCIAPARSSQAVRWRPAMCRLLAATPDRIERALGHLFGEDTELVTRWTGTALRVPSVAYFWCTLHLQTITSL